MQKALSIFADAGIDQKDALEEACAKLGFRVVYGSRLDFGHLDVLTTIFVSPALPMVSARYWIATKAAEGLARKVLDNDEDRRQFVDIVRSLLLMPKAEFRTRSKLNVSKDALATVFGVPVSDIDFRESLAALEQA